ncbi:helix-turn-helix domain-containing protein [Peristeroidobacter agariperforans]|uniref:helix-turn-helix domain-containing protein n=1 Tax=Peristeroidobacter agariperforans TaxID=268404 RepID=UPI00101BF4AC|nr:AraC family transcriptional regulator [Peristeroidobacter agariperforans]
MKDDIRFRALPVPGIEAMHATSQRSFPRHTHDQYGIGMVDAGKHASWSGRGQVEAGPRSFICVNPSEVHDGQAADGGRSWRMLYLSPHSLAAMCSDIGDGARSELMFSAPVFEDRGLQPIFNAAFSHCLHREEHGTVACETDMLSLIAGLLHHSSAKAARDHGLTGCISRARQMIDDDPTRPLTLASLAKEAGLSKYRLLRSFARELGLTPHAYIVQRRIAYAQGLIKSGRGLAEAALAAGFYDQSHLTRCFVRQLGVTPRGYAEGSHPG